MRTVEITRRLLVATCLGAALAGCASQGSNRAPAAAADPAATTFDEQATVKAAEEAFGKGAQGVAKVVERVFADLGRPNAYIAGEEAGGALVAGLRYGSGELHHKVEGKRKVYWAGPSLGPDVGGDASKTFTLVYNLYDTEELFHRRYPAAEGKAYAIGGFSVQYHQRGNVILVPIHLGVGWRFGANIGYLRYSKERQLMPF